MGKSYCIFSAQYLPHMGGVENYTYHLSQELLKRGCRVTVVSSQIDGLSEQDLWDGIEIYRLPCLNLLNGRFPVLKPTGAYRRMMKKLRQQHFDFVLINTRFYFHSLCGARFARKQRIPHAVIEHGSQHLTIDHPLLDRMGQCFEHFLTSLVKRNCNYFYGVSNASNEWLAHFHIRANGVAYNAIDLAAIERHLAQPKEDYRSQYKIPKTDLVISFTGRLVKEKGILNLIDAVERLRKHNPNVWLMIAGDGPLQTQIEQRLQTGQKIILLGRISFEQVIALLGQSDIFCLPSESEGFPTSVLEAAACKNYVITTERGGAKELILNRDYGMILLDNQTERLLESLQAAIADPEGRSRAAELCYQRLKENFTWKVTADTVEKIADQCSCN